MSGPPKHRLVVNGSPVSNCSMETPSGEIDVIAPLNSVPTHPAGAVDGERVEQLQVGQPAQQGPGIRGERVVIRSSTPGSTTRRRNTRPV